jgi:Endonuclease/Exonuclease/phosphatase family
MVIVNLPPDLKRATKSISNLSEPNTSPLDIFVLTWNMNGKLPDPKHLSKLFPILTSVLVISTQECEKPLKESILFPSLYEWKAMMDLYLCPIGYEMVEMETLVGINMMIYVDQKSLGSLSNFKKYKVMTGFQGMLGNKGGVVISFDYRSGKGKIRKLAIVNVHLSAHENRKQVRNQEFHKINATLHDSYDYTLFSGDLNYRVDQNRGFVDILLSKNDIQSLLNCDELTIEKKTGKVFVGYTEAEILFPPTFKLVPGYLAKYSEKRIPSWTDRILYKTKKATFKDLLLHGIRYNHDLKIDCLNYSSIPVVDNVSDHLPVYAHFHIS